MLNFILWYLVFSAICDLLFIVVMLNYSKKMGEW